MDMNPQDLLGALAPALTDADARAAFLADPRSALAAAGLDVPDWIAVTAREGDTPELALVLPPLLDMDGELSEEQLAVVSGGCSSCAVCGPDAPW
jgi:hypothetical protein